LVVLLSGAASFCTGVDLIVDGGAQVKTVVKASLSSRAW
jgi:hypothetical protein